MKLKNKKTGEIIDIKDALRDSYDYPNHYLISGDWEDYEEPKVGYMIDPMEEDCVSADDSGYEEPDVKRAKELGIWFETKEEAEKEVEKFKAWQRLKDKGLSFRHWKEAQLRPHSSCIAITGNMECDAEARKDLDLLFGGEE